MVWLIVLFQFDINLNSNSYSKRYHNINLTYFMEVHKFNDMNYVKFFACLFDYYAIPGVFFENRLTSWTSKTIKYVLSRCLNRLVL